MSIRTANQYRNGFDDPLGERCLSDTPVSSDLLTPIPDSIKNKLGNFPDSGRLAINGDAFVLQIPTQSSNPIYLHVPERGFANLVIAETYKGNPAYGSVDKIDIYGAPIPDNELPEILDIVKNEVPSFGIQLADPDNIWIRALIDTDLLELSDPKTIYDLSSDHTIIDEMFTRMRDKKLLDIDEFTNVRHDLRNISEKTRAYASKLADAGLCVIVPDIDTVAVLMDTATKNGMGEAGTYLIDTRDHGSFIMPLKDGVGDFDYIEHDAELIPLTPNTATEIRTFLARNAQELAETWKTPDWQTKDPDTHPAANKLCEIINDIKSPNPIPVIAASTVDYQAWPEITKTIQTFDTQDLVRVSRIKPEISAALSELEVSETKAKDQKTDTLQYT